MGKIGTPEGLKVLPVPSKPLGRRHVEGAHAANLARKCPSEARLYYARETRRTSREQLGKTERVAWQSPAPRWAAPFYFSRFTPHAFSLPYPSNGSVSRRAL